MKVQPRQLTLTATLVALTRGLVAVAIYHLHVKNISRGDGRSAVAAAAYRAGETLPNELEERDSAFGGRRDVLHTEIRLPAGAPAWMADRARLWNAVEAAEKRKDSRLAKEIEFALPRELPRDLWLAVAREMGDAYTSRGYVVDIAIHADKLAENPHVHMMLSTRAITVDGFGGKLREADGLKFVTEARALWARIANTALGKIGAGVEIDARSYAARGVTQEPSTHRGPDRAERRARRERAEQGEAMTEIRNPQPEASERDRIEALEAENRALREALASKEREAERDLPVPDPDGRPIHPDELRAAEDLMVRESEYPARNIPTIPRPERQPPDERTAAREAVDRQLAIEVPQHDADAYRIAPHENHLDWLDGSPAPDHHSAGRERGDDHLDWLRPEDRTPKPTQDEQERERER
ncbi:MobA/MobL family protein [Methylosinus sporium]|uniref:MobA/MobL family protein n=1 Tax=Methylosinus sporium TaxID=428 RepID=UPI001FEF3219|nr:MobA/MobL family protein [Methylosinus sporium]